jgi:hypothetical protein
MVKTYYSRSARKRPARTALRYPSAAEVAASLRGKRQANGSYLCPCPCGLHRRGDIHPSLGVTNGQCGRPVFHCFSGGDFRDIIDALIARGVCPRLR